MALFKGDITNAKDIEAVFEAYKGKGGIWGVIHIAAHKAVGESGEKPIQYYQNNINASIDLIDVMNRYNCHNLVYSSSATVYGAPQTIPIPESTPLDPQSVYGRTKAMSEWIMNDVANSDPKWRMIALRYFNPAGAHPSGLIGEDPVGKPGNLLPLLAQIAVGRIKDELQVFGNDYPTPDGACVVREHLQRHSGRNDLTLSVTLARLYSHHGLGRRAHHCAPGPGERRHLQEVGLSQGI